MHTKALTERASPRCSEMAQKQGAQARGTSFSLRICILCTSPDNGHLPCAHPPREESSSNKTCQSMPLPNQDKVKVHSCRDCRAEAVNVQGKRQRPFKQALPANSLLLAVDRADEVARAPAQNRYRTKSALARQSAQGTTNNAGGRALCARNNQQHQPEAAFCTGPTWQRQLNQDDSPTVEQCKHTHT